MKNCIKCNAQLSDNDVFCPSCGTKQEQQGSQSAQEPYTTPLYEYLQTYSPQYSQYPQTPPQVSNDKNSIGFDILCFLFPLIGFILFCVWHKEHPKKAKGVGISALISVILSIVISIIIAIAGVGTFASLNKQQTDNTLNDFEYSYSEDSNVEDEKNDTSSTKISDWTSYVFTIDGVDIQLPSTYNEFSSATSYVWDGEIAEPNKLLAPNEYYAEILVKGDKQVMLSFINNSNVDTALKDTIIIGVTVYSSDGPSVTINGLSVGQTIDSNGVINAVGTPSDTYDSDTDDYQVLMYYDGDNDNNEFKVTLSNGIISQLQLTKTK